MKCLLIPVDFSATTTNLLQYVAHLSYDYQIEEIILLKIFHISQLAQLFPSPDLIQMGIAEIAALKQEEEIKFKQLGVNFLKKVNPATKTDFVFVTEELLPTIAYLLENKEPGLIAIGNPMNSDDNEISLRDFIIPIAKMSTVPVLLVPDKIKYKAFTRVLLPTSFANLQKINSFKKLAQSQSWLNAGIFVLNVDDTHRHDEVEADDDEMIAKYLDGYHFQIDYTYGQDVAKEILRYAEQQDVQLILALPGKHSFLYNLTHKSVTKRFALEAQFPILLLK